MKKFKKIAGFGLLDSFLALILFVPGIYLYVQYHEIGHDEKAVISYYSELNRDVFAFDTLINGPALTRAQVDTYHYRTIANILRNSPTNLTSTKSNVACVVNSNSLITQSCVSQLPFSEDPLFGGTFPVAAYGRYNTQINNQLNLKHSNNLKPNLCIFFNGNFKSYDLYLYYTESKPLSNIEKLKYQKAAAKFGSIAGIVDSSGQLKSSAGWTMPAQCGSPIVGSYGVYLNLLPDFLSLREDNIKLLTNKDDNAMLSFPGNTNTLKTDLYIQGTTGGPGNDSYLQTGATTDGYQELNIGNKQFSDKGMTGSIITNLLIVQPTATRQQKPDPSVSETSPKFRASGFSLVNTGADFQKFMSPGEAAPSYTSNLTNYQMFAPCDASIELGRIVQATNPRTGNKEFAICMRHPYCNEFSRLSKGISETCYMNMVDKRDVINVNSDTQYITNDYSCNPNDSSCNPYKSDPSCQLIQSYVAQQCLTWRYKHDVGCRATITTDCNAGGQLCTPGACGGKDECHACNGTVWGLDRGYDPVCLNSTQGQPAIYRCTSIKQSTFRCDTDTGGKDLTPYIAAIPQVRSESINFEILPIIENGISKFQNNIEYVYNGKRQVTQNRCTSYFLGACVYNKCWLTEAPFNPLVYELSRQAGAYAYDPQNSCNPGIPMKSSYSAYNSNGKGFMMKDPNIGGYALDSVATNQTMILYHLDGTSEWWNGAGSWSQKPQPFNLDVKSGNLNGCGFVNLSRMVSNGAFDAMYYPSPTTNTNHNFYGIATGASRSGDNSAACNDASQNFNPYRTYDSKNITLPYYLEGNTKSINGQLKLNGVVNPGDNWWKLMSLTKSEKKDLLRIQFEFTKVEAPGTNTHIMTADQASFDNYASGVAFKNNSAIPDCQMQCNAVFRKNGWTGELYYHDYDLIKGYQNSNSCVCYQNLGWNGQNYYLKGNTNMTLIRARSDSMFKLKNVTCGNNPLYFSNRVAPDNQGVVPTRFMSNGQSAWGRGIANSYTPEQPERICQNSSVRVQYSTACQGSFVNNVTCTPNRTNIFVGSTITYNNPVNRCNQKSADGKITYSALTSNIYVNCNYRSEPSWYQNGSNGITGASIGATCNAYNF